MKEGDFLLVWSNHNGMPNDINIYFSDDGWAYATVWTVKLFPDLRSLLQSMIHNGIVTVEYAERIRKTILRKRLLERMKENEEQ